MEKLPKRAWDWALAGLLLLIVLTAGARLAATDWTTHLYVGEAMGVLGACVGLALGASRWSPRVTRWIGLGYTLTVVPLQLTVVSEQKAPLADKLSEIALRVGTGLVTVYNGQKLDDPILFIAFAALTFWLMAQIGGFRLARKHEPLPALLPAGLVILVVQAYDAEQPARLWMFAFYLFLGLLLAGRTYYLDNSKSWRETRVLQTPDTGREWARGLLLASALVVLISWTFPLSVSSLKAATEFWREFIRPLQPVKEDIARALDPLDSPYGSRAEKADFYGETLALGRGLPLSDDLIFRVYAPEDLVNPPPRFYWRGRVFSAYDGANWINLAPTRQAYESLPADIRIPDMTLREIAVFTVRNGTEQTLMYSPGQIVWAGKPGQMTYYPLPNNERDLLVIQAESTLQKSESYRVHAALVNPSIEELRGAPTEYPDWVVRTYLQLPANFSPRIRELAQQLAQGQETPYDKALAVTQWLRTEIEYQDVIPAPPPNVDALEWALFEYKRGFCMYYASAEVLMLRSLGIPARMAVGFAQGALDEETNSYTVLRRDYHAWPEVYFPGIGWVEFEPTANQEALVRPLTHEISSPAPIEKPAVTPAATEPPPEPAQDEKRNVASWMATHRSAIVWICWIAILLSLWGLDRLTGWVGRLPIYVESRVERSGRRPPRWISLWAAWARLSPIARAYETINLSLRMMGAPQPVYATPAERARKLTSLVPAAQSRVQGLREAHERALYAGAESSPSAARLSAFIILLSTIRARLIQLGNSFEERFSRPDSFQ